MSFAFRIFHDTIANDPDLAVPQDLTIQHIATGNSSLIKLVHFANLHVGYDLLLDLRLQHTFHRTLDLFDGVVDDGIQLDLHTFRTCELIGLQ